MMEEAYSKYSHTRDFKLPRTCHKQIISTFSTSSSIKSPTATYCHTTPYTSARTRGTGAFRAHRREKPDQVHPLHRRSLHLWSTPPSYWFEYAGTINNSQDPIRLNGNTRWYADRCLYSKLMLVTVASLITSTV